MALRQHEAELDAEKDKDHGGCGGEDPPKMETLGLACGNIHCGLWGDLKAAAIARRDGLGGAVAIRDGCCDRSKESIAATGYGLDEDGILGGIAKGVP